ncbi:phage baseplate assembly protein V [Zooshikella marina]|uniref:phage baseplate assembly protein V n=1 Tax=Zooshikella ganghwensis TaxID=202772 RepID=UPI001BB0394C|nr:phage baseplate assembly protein V [Zooshikella ganghwensis]MBU2707538.1 phage baseplate assembly protein V [Zooshikella ganghwensis]
MSEYAPTPINKNQKELQLRKKLSEHEKQLNSQILIGKVVGTRKSDRKKNDPPKPTDRPTVLVQFGINDDDDAKIRNWLGWTSSRAGCDAELWMPEINEQVVIVAPNGNIGLGLIIGALYRGNSLQFKEEESYKKEVAEIKSMPNEKNLCNKHIRCYHDGSELHYDKKNHIFTFFLKNKPEAVNPRLKIEADAKNSKGLVNLLIGEDKTDQLSIKANSQELVISHTKSTKTKLVVNFRKGDIAIYADNKISLKANEVHIDAGTKMKINNKGVDVRK